MPIKQIQKSDPPWIKTDIPFIKTNTFSTKATDRVTESQGRNLPSTELMSYT